MNPATRTHPLDDEAIDRIWMAAAAEVGLRVERTTEAYASTDGRGLLTIGAPETLDPDDSLAQLVLHELCYAGVQGQGTLRAFDWGLDTTPERYLPSEQGCLRLQAHLADRHAPRGLLAPTTVVRPYYDALPPFPLEGSDPAAALARGAAGRAAQPPWAAALERALAATAERVVASGRFAAGSGHPLGGPITPGACGGCAWAYLDRAGELRCRPRGGPDGNGHRVDARWPACSRWERPLDCRSCAACCREGFDRVTVGVREEVV